MTRFRKMPGAAALLPVALLACTSAQGQAQVQVQLLHCSQLTSCHISWAAIICCTVASYSSTVAWRTFAMGLPLAGFTDVDTLPDPPHLPL